MALIQLSWRAQQVLKQIARAGSNGRMARRALALLWLHTGERVAVVARRLGLSRAAIYQVVARYRARLGQPVAERVRDAPHPGRPADQRLQVAAVVAELLDTPPAQYGYRGFAWTTPMLRRQAECRLARLVCERTVRRALRAVRLRYKRPRYGLARRAATWGQAKGGSSAA